jgi:hypothetical protein
MTFDWAGHWLQYLFWLSWTLTAVFILTGLNIDCSIYFGWAEHWLQYLFWLGWTLTAVFILTGLNIDCSIYFDLAEHWLQYLFWLSWTLTAVFILTGLNIDCSIYFDWAEHWLQYLLYEDCGVGGYVITVLKNSTLVSNNTAHARVCESTAKFYVVRARWYVCGM